MKPSDHVVSTLFYTIAGVCILWAMMIANTINSTIVPSSALLIFFVLFLLVITKPLALEYKKGRQRGRICKYTGDIIMLNQEQQKEIINA